MAITYNAGTDTITVTGYTEGTPCTFLDIYNADVSGSWGQVTRQCQNQHCFNCKLVVGDGSTATWFKDVNAHVTLNKDATGYVIETKTNSNFQLGECDANDRTSKGCGIYGISSANATAIQFSGNVKIYNTSFAHSDDDYINPRLNTTGTVEIIDTIIWNGWSSLLFLATPSTQILKRITVLGGAVGIQTDGANVTASDIIIMNAQKPFRAKNSTINATDISFEGETYLAQMQDNGLLNMYDCPVSASNIEDSGSNWVVNEYFHFNLKVIDKDEVAIGGATVKIWDKNSVLVVDTTTGAGGTISEQTLQYATRPDTQTRSMKTPHLIKIEKAGYTTYEADFTLEEKTDWLIALQATGGGLLRNPPMTGGMV